MGLPGSKSITPQKIDFRHISKINKTKILNNFSCRVSKAEFQTKITITLKDIKLKDKISYCMP